MPLDPALLQMLNELPVDDDFKTGIRLEAIFMPDARRRRDKLYIGQTKPPRFVHYTSAYAALQIIEKKRVWLRNTTCMADYREVQHGYDMLLEYFNTPAKAALRASLDTVFDGVFDEAVSIFDRWWADTRFGTYIASLSEHDDKEDQNGRLSMWRAFGTGSPGPKVAIVLTPPAFSKSLASLEVSFSPVSYISSGKTSEILDEVRDNVDDQVSYLQQAGRETVVANIFQMLLSAVTCVKHDGFEEEREWRAVYAPSRRFSPLIDQVVETVGGVPQIVCQLPLDQTASPDLADLDFATMFDRLIIGPTQYPVAVMEAFRVKLDKAGVANAASRIVASNIPIRSSG